jgi:dihydrofolate synthase/folylpolyglutamate synthase
MTPHETQQYLDSLINYELDMTPLKDKGVSSGFTLKRIQYLLELLGSPHKGFKCIHIAGTNGKGSSAVFTANILKQAGYKVGLYTSPHLNSCRERIRILSLDVEREDGGIFSGSIKQEEVYNLIEEIRPHIEKVKNTHGLGMLSYFEVLTALAFYYFRQENVDYAVIEVGLGGRLDATNIVDAYVSAITSIGFEHTQYLGETLEAIAEEKAAIIKKQGQIVIIAPQEKEVVEVIQQRCHEMGAKPYYIGRDIECGLCDKNIEGQALCVKGIGSVEYNIRMSLLGTHQIINAAVAIGMIESLSTRGDYIDEASIVKGIKETLWPARFEILKQGPFIVIDSAHNPSSCKQLAHTLKEIFPHNKTTLILGISKDKDKCGILKTLASASDEVILTKAGHPRADSLTDPVLIQVLKDKKHEYKSNVVEAIDAALKSAKNDDVILITGSIYLAAEARERLVEETIDQRP